MRRLVGGVGYASATSPADIEFAWSGNVSSSGATVKVRSSGTPTLLYGTDAELVDPANLSGSEGSDDIWTYSLSGLDDDTTYYYSFPGWDFTGQFRTFVTSGSFSIAAASCAGAPDGFSGPEYVTGPDNTSDSPAFDRIRDREPALFIHMGDFHYRHPAVLSDYRTGYRDVMENARQAHLYRSVPIAYIWDDHDYGTDNSDGTYSGKAAAQQAYREYVPHATLAEASALYHTFVIGRVRFIVLDCRSNRSPNTATDNSSKTMLGATQKQWFKDELDDATEPCIVVVSSVPWNPTYADNDNWGGFSTEATELAEYMTDNGHTEKIFWLSGDRHFLAGDDGTNTQFDSGTMDPGAPLVVFAPLDAGHTPLTGNGTYTEGPYGTSNQQYGTLEFTDTGSQITVTAKGWAVTDETEAEVFSLSKIYTG